MTAEERIAELEAEIKTQKIQINKLSREIRMNKNFLNKANAFMESKALLSSAAEAAREKQRVYTDLLIKLCPNAIILLDNKLNFVLATKFFLEMINVTEFNSIEKIPCDTVFGKYMTAETAEALKEMITETIREQKDTNTKRWLDFGGNDTGYYQVEVTIISADGIATMHHINGGVILVLSDLTELMKEKMNAEKANRAKSDFLATMSHEIRTPMNAVLGFSEMLERTVLDKRQSAYVRDISRSSISLLSVINDILDFSKIEAEKFEVVNDPFDLHGMLRSIQSMLKFMFMSKNLELIFHVDDNVPPFIISDEKRVRQIITNLLSNACKYTSKGFGKLRVSCSGETVYFNISDSGLGIKPDDIEKLFRPFEQLDLRKNKNVVGTGLGLAISFKLAELLGGNLKVESVYGEGASFTFSMPCVIFDGMIESLKDSESEEFAAPTANVLVVDDNEINLTVANALLGTFEITATLAGSGAEAISLVKGNDFDIVFMDQMMPKMDGVECTQIIRGFEEEKYEELPIIALTANAIAGAKESLIGQGMTDFLSKPIDIEKMGEMLLRWLPNEKIVRVPKKGAELLNAFAHIKGLDIAKGIANADNDEKRYVLNLRNACNDTKNLVLSMPSPMAAENVRDVRDVVKKLKGVFAGIGAAEIAKSAFVFEKECGDWNYCIRNISALLDSVLDFAAKIDDAMAN